MAISPRLLLVDGSALIYRAYYAIPPHFTTADGLHTNAVYGFATMFRKMLSGRRPEHGAVIFDAPGPTFRDERYPDYKAQRPSMGDDLREQLPWIDKLVAAHRFPMLRVPGWEADDVIGTLTRQAVDAGMEVVIVSGDKDFAQLIGDRVKMIDTLRDVTYDRELVIKKWGVPPEQFVDLLAMVGDKSDNIPGVPGIGQKGAAKLLAAHGTLAGIYEHLGELKGRPRTALEEHREQAWMSRELATIDTAVELGQGLDDLVLDLPEPAALNDLYRELEFLSLLSVDEERQQARVEEADYAAVTSIGELDAFLADLPAEPPPALWTVCDAPGPVQGALAGLAISTAPGTARWVPLAGDGGLGADAAGRVGEWLADPARPKVTYNAKALWIAARKLGVEVEGIVGDALLESFLVDPTKIIPHRFEQVAREYLRRTVPPAKTLLGGGKSERPFTAVPLAELTPWACQQGDALFQVWPVLRERLEEAGQRAVLDDVDLPLARVLAGMELAGIAVDPDDLALMGEEFRARLDGIEAEIYDLAGKQFNIGSPKQLGQVLFEDLGLPVIKRTKSGYSTAAEVLERLAPKHEIASRVLEQRKLAKLINTYTDVLQRAADPRTGRIHTTFQQTVGATGRLITTDPDLQRTPIKTPEGRRIRQSFVPQEGRRLISADWSQIELRLLAHFTADPRLVEAFRDDLDIHRRTAAELFDVADEDVTSAQRGIGKLVNFATIYGQGATALGQILGVPRKEAQSYIDGYFEAYGGVRTWLDRTMEQAHEDGYVTTLLGRRRHIPELSSASFMDRQAGERIAANTPIQGSAADLCKLAMLDVDRRLTQGGHATRMLLQVHDELVFEAPPDEVDAVCDLVRDAMENVHPLEVPLVAEVGVGNSWAEAH